MEINGLFVVIAGVLFFMAYIGWFHYRPMNRQLCRENGDLRRQLDDERRQHPGFDWALDQRLAKVRESRLQAEVDKMYRGWHTQ